MGDLPYISSEQGIGLIIHTEHIYEYTIYKRPIPIQEVRAEEGGGLTFYTVHKFHPRCAGHVTKMTFCTLPTLGLAMLLNDLCTLATLGTVCTLQQRTIAN